MPSGVAVPYVSSMADQPDPPEKWRVYEGDPTPEPEPEAPTTPPQVPYGAPQPPPQVPYGQSTYQPVIITTTSSGTGPKLILVMVAIAVLGVVAAGAIAIFSAVDSIPGVSSIDAKSPEDFAELVDKLEEERGSTEVFWVGLYDGYIIVDAPYTDDAGDTREISYRWDGGDLEESTRGTSSDPRFDLASIDPDVIEGMCDPVLDLAQGATPGDCYVFLSKPGAPFGGDTWFRAGASDEFGQYFSIEYDKSGKEIQRTLPQ